jgi:hypothetical protein
MLPWNVLAPVSDETDGPFLLVSCLVYPSTLMIEFVRSSETSVDLYQIKWRSIPEYNILKCELFHNYIIEGREICVTMTEEVLLQHLHSKYYFSSFV